MLDGVYVAAELAEVGGDHLEGIDVVEAVALEGAVADLAALEEFAGGDEVRLGPLGDFVEEFFGAVGGRALLEEFLDADGALGGLAVVTDLEEDLGGVHLVGADGEAEGFEELVGAVGDVEAGEAGVVPAEDDGLVMGLDVELAGEVGVGFHVDEDEDGLVGDGPDPGVGEEVFKVLAEAAPVDGEDEDGGGAGEAGTGEAYFGVEDPGVLRLLGTKGAGEGEQDEREEDNGAQERSSGWVVEILYPGRE
jgi:hypothetical protein